MPAAGPLKGDTGSASRPPDRASQLVRQFASSEPMASVNRSRLLCPELQSPAGHHQGEHQKQDRASRKPHGQLHRGSDRDVDTHGPTPAPIQPRSNHVVPRSHREDDGLQFLHRACSDAVDIDRHASATRCDQMTSGYADLSETSVVLGPRITIRRHGDVATSTESRGDGQRVLTVRAHRPRRAHRSGHRERLIARRAREPLRTTVWPHALLIDPCLRSL